MVGGGSAINTITFSKPVENPIMTILSLGRGFMKVCYEFNAPFDVLSSGRGYFGGRVKSLIELPGNILEGHEGHGVIRFKGTYSSISWKVPVREYWHGFTIGLESDPLE